MSVVSESERRVTPADVDAHRAVTERMRVIADFLARPVHAHGGADDTDPDVVTEYNLTVAIALKAFRRDALD